jgi:hypothetical protein
MGAGHRVTLTTVMGTERVPVSFDNATKLLDFGEPNTTVGAVTYGQATIGIQNPRTAASFSPEFESSLPTTRLSVKEFAKALSDFFLAEWQRSMPSNYAGAAMTFVIAGFDVDAVYGQVYVVEIPYLPNPIERQPGATFGITYGGQREIMDRILHGCDNRLEAELTRDLNLQPNQVTTMQQALGRFSAAIPLQALALQDCVDLAIFFIRATVGVQSFTVGIRGVGGSIDVATITRNKKLHFVQRKTVRGEYD